MLRDRFLVEVREEGEGKGRSFRAGLDRLVRARRIRRDLRLRALEVGLPEFEAKKKVEVAGLESQTNWASAIEPRLRVAERLGKADDIMVRALPSVRWAECRALPVLASAAARKQRPTGPTTIYGGSSVLPSCSPLGPSNAGVSRARQRVGSTP